MVEKKAPAGEKPAEVAAEAPQVDRVALVSVRADGTPDQREGFEILPGAESDGV